MEVGRDQDKRIDITDISLQAISIQLEFTVLWYVGIHGFLNTMFLFSPNLSKLYLIDFNIFLFISYVI
jgi:hypothetical protein